MIRKFCKSDSSFSGIFDDTVNYWSGKGSIVNKLSAGYLDQPVIPASTEMTPAEAAAMAAEYERSNPGGSGTVTVTTQPRVAVAQPTNTNRTVYGPPAPISIPSQSIIVDRGSGVQSGTMGMTIGQKIMLGVGGVAAVLLGAYILKKRREAGTNKNGR